MWTHLIVDLDNTLYSARTGVFDLVDARIQSFLTERLRIPDAQARALRVRWMSRFGTTLRGLRLYFPDVDPMEFMDYAHDIPLEAFLQPMPELRSVLQTIPVRRVIFSNSDRKHTVRVLELLGIADLFDGWITIEDLGMIPKPNWEAYATLVRRLHLIPSRSLYVDDLMRNVRMGHRWGFQCIWVHDGKAPTGRLAPRLVGIRSILDLPEGLMFL